MPRGQFKARVEPDVLVHISLQLDDLAALEGNQIPDPENQLPVQTDDLPRAHHMPHDGNLSDMPLQLPQVIVLHFHIRVPDANHRPLAIAHDVAVLIITENQVPYVAVLYLKEDILLQHLDLSPLPDVINLDIALITPHCDGVVAIHLGDGAAEREGVYLVGELELNEFLISNKHIVKAEYGIVIQRDKLLLVLGEKLTHDMVLNGDAEKAVREGLAVKDPDSRLTGEQQNIVLFVHILNSMEVQDHNFHNSNFLRDVLRLHLLLQQGVIVLYCTDKFLLFVYEVKLFLSFVVDVIFVVYV